MWEVGLPPLLWSFPPMSSFTSFPAPGFWVGATAPAFSSWLVYVQFCEGLPIPPFGAQGALPSLLCVFFVVIAYYSFFSFFPGCESVCPGGYAGLAQGCLWEYHMPLISPCDLHLPKRCGGWCLVAREPSWLFHLR
jgi:hypothetical protein